MSSRYCQAFFKKDSVLFASNKDNGNENEGWRYGEGADNFGISSVLGIEMRFYGIL